MEGQKPQRIGIGKAIFLVVLALICDGIGALINLIPIAGQFIAVLFSGLAYLAFGLGFYIAGINVLNIKHAKRFIGPVIIEAIPIINIIPGLTLSVLLTVLFVMAEDRGVSKPLPKPKMRRNLRNLRQGGIGRKNTGKNDSPQRSNQRSTPRSTQGSASPYSAKSPGAAPVDANPTAPARREASPV